MDVSVILPVINETYSLYKTVKVIKKVLVNILKNILLLYVNLPLENH